MEKSHFLRYTYTHLRLLYNKDIFFIYIYIYISSKALASCEKNVYSSKKTFSTQNFCGHFISSENLRYFFRPTSTNWVSSRISLIRTVSHSVWFPWKPSKKQKESSRKSSKKIVRLHHFAFSICLFNFSQIAIFFYLPSFF